MEFSASYIELAMEMQRDSVAYMDGYLYMFLLAAELVDSDRPCYAGIGWTEPSIEMGMFCCHIIGHLVFILRWESRRGQSPENEMGLVDERGQDRPPWRSKIRASERHVHLLDINIILKVKYRDMTLDLLFRAWNLIRRHEANVPSHHPGGDMLLRPRDSQSRIEKFTDQATDNTCTQSLTESCFCSLKYQLRWHLVNWQC
jgi:hypothetical protein